MSVEQPNVIDFISTDDNSDTVFLTISDHLDWDDDIHEHLLLLQEKINSYLKFVETGEIESEYPKAKGKKRRIRIALKFEPDEHGMRFLESVKAKLMTDTDIGFDYHVFHEE
jgi:hypothetical protein